jgi:thymidylate synthase (FAD)
METFERQTPTRVFLPEITVLDLEGVTCVEDANIRVLRDGLRADVGHVTLIDSMGTDDDLAYAARTSFRHKGKKPAGDLINYLWKNRHTSPFEMAVAKFETCAPIAVMRQWMRHRTQSYNEESMRYTEALPYVHVPSKYAFRDTRPGANKQMAGLPVGELQNLATRALVVEGLTQQYLLYRSLLGSGISREDARLVLPLGMMTSAVVCANLLNWLRFLTQRNAPKAQWQIREYASAIQYQLAQRFPLTFAAFAESQVL